MLSLARPSAPPSDRTEPRSRGRAFTDLRVLLGEMLLTQGASATAAALRPQRPRPGGQEELELFRQGGGAGALPRGWRRVLDWAPLAVGAAAGAAEIAYALSPTPRNRTIGRILGGTVVGVGAALVTDSLRASLRGERPPSLPHLSFTMLGLASLVLHPREAVLPGVRGHPRPVLPAPSGRGRVRRVRLER